MLSVSIFQKTRQEHKNSQITITPTLITERRCKEEEGDREGCLEVETTKQSIYNVTVMVMD